MVSPCPRWKFSKNCLFIFICCPVTKFDSAKFSFLDRLRIRQCYPWTQCGQVSDIRRVESRAYKLVITSSLQSKNIWNQTLLCRSCFYQTFVHLLKIPDSIHLLIANFGIIQNNLSNHSIIQSAHVVPRPRLFTSCPSTHSAVLVDHTIRTLGTVSVDSNEMKTQ